MKSLLLLLFLVGTSPGKTHVFLCKSSSSITYHSRKDCRGMKGCLQDVVEVGLDEATDQYKKKPCKICCKEPELPFFPFPVIVPIDGQDK